MTIPRNLSFLAEGASSTGVLGVPNGGSAATTLTGYLIGNGTSAFTASSTIPTSALSGTISNAQLANSSLTVNGTSISLGASGTVTAAAGTLTGTTLNSTVVTSSLTSVGTLTSGTWNASTIGATYGGTGQNTVTTGDLLYGSATNTWSKLSIGSTGTILRVVGGIPSWGTDYTGTVTSVAASVPSFLSISGSPITTSGTLAITYSGTALPVANGGTGLTSLSTGYILYGNGTSAFQSSSNLTFNGTLFSLTNAASTQSFSGSNLNIGIGTAFAGGQTDVYTVSTNPMGIGTTGSAALNLYTASVQRLSISSAGIVTMSTYGAGAATFSASGVISSVSDETWKIKDGVPSNPDSMLKALVPGYWYYNSEKADIFGKERQLGFYAQNVNAAIGPEAAPIPEEGKPWGYYDRSVLAVVVLSLQNVLATVEDLQNQIKVLQGK